MSFQRQSLTRQKDAVQCLRYPSRARYEAKPPYCRRFAVSAQASQTSDWSSMQYLKFGDQRTMPVRDLLAKVPVTAPKRVIDLGCGPGNSTTVLKERYPDAEIMGMDSSADMLKKARKTLPGLEFHEADLESYQPEQPADLLFSNAVFHWLPDKQRVPIMERLLETLAPGGVLAIQVPDNADEPSHSLMRETAKKGPWREELEKRDPAIPYFPAPAKLYNALKPLCSSVDIWRTNYFHVLDNHEAIVEWVKGTGLRPFVDPLPAFQRKLFLLRYLEKLRAGYAPLEDGKVMLRYPRLFVVAVRA